MDFEILDGGFGTMIQAAGLPAGKDPGDWNIENPGAVAAVHRAYVDAGAQVVLANTFGANRLKYRGAFDVDEVVRAGVRTARMAAGGARVALDVGPTGRLLRPVGDLDFEEAVEAYAEQVKAGADAGADLVFIETMGDLHELKAAVVAAKENCALPVYATVALDEGGRLLTGASVETIAALLESLGVDAYGFNCGLSPELMLPFVRRLAEASTRPVIVKPNAGMPRVEGGRTVFDIGPEEFARHMAGLIAAGATVVGGCCGTTPGHIRAMAGRAVQDLKVGLLPGRDAARPSPGARYPDGRARVTVTSGSSLVTLESGRGTIIGERINPTGKKLLKEAYASGDTAYVLREAVKQVDVGAEILDVNCGVPGLDERALLRATVLDVQSVVASPIQIDTSDPAALEAAIRGTDGKPLVNSVNGGRASMNAVFPIVKRYGGAIVALCLDEEGIPETAEGRLAIARRILDEGAKYGFTRDDFIFDALTLAVSSDSNAALVTLETVKRLTEELGVNTVLGVSNVSFGLPGRAELNNAMYALAKRAGLSAAIANPAVIRDELTPGAEDLLLGRDPGAERWIAAKTAYPQPSTPNSQPSTPNPQPSTPNPQPSTPNPQPPTLNSLRTAIEHGLAEDARAAAETAIRSGREPMALVKDEIVPALETVGKGFEKGTVFLPQLLKAADAAGAAFEVIKEELANAAEVVSPGRKPIVIATVKGDVHDIGKNIVRALLENYGYDVIDLGRDVPEDRIVESAVRNDAGMVCLSALMTTTVGAMAETIRRLKAVRPDCPVCVGGAVVTEEFAASIGADYYSKDAMANVRIAGEVLG